jgi:hypothetical protein
MNERTYNFRVKGGQACIVAAASLLIASAPALGGVVAPVLEMDIQVFSTSDTNTPIFDQVYNPVNSGTIGPAGSNAWGFDVGVLDQNFNISGEINASPTTSPTSAFLNPTLNFANNSAESLWFMITIKMPTAHMFSEPLEWSSSASWTLTGPEPELTTLPDTSLWSVSTDGHTVGSLFSDSTVMNNDNLNISDEMGGLLPGQVADYMMITLAFELSPNAIGGVNGIFTVIPTPGALALLACAGLFGTTRKRRM